MLRKETDIIKFEYCIREKNVYALLNIIPVMFDGDGLLTQVMMIGQDVGQKVELENLANTDGLTGLYNERYFSRVLANLEKKKLPFALYYLDLDFSSPSTTYGHDMGDKLLKAVAQRLQTCIRSRDCAFRIGGDEFAVVYRADLTDAQRREKAGAHRRNADPTLRDRRKAPANRRELRLCPLSRRQRGGGGYPHSGRPAHVCRKGKKPQKKVGGR